MTVALTLHKLLITITDEELKEKIQSLYAETYREGYKDGAEDQRDKCGCEEEED